MNHLQEEYFLKMYQEFLNEVEGTNGHILIEGINRYESPYMNNLADCADVVKKINHPNAGVLADFFHMSIEEVNLPQSILDCGHLIRHVHLGDSNRLLPGNGNTDWKGCFEALKQIGYSGYLNLECAIQGPFTKVEQSLNYMKTIIEG
jgi:sugar phosphate isomerase/epimerase